MYVSAGSKFWYVKCTLKVKRMLSCLVKILSHNICSKLYKSKKYCSNQSLHKTNIQMLQYENEVCRVQHIKQFKYKFLSLSANLYAFPNTTHSQNRIKDWCYFVYGMANRYWEPSLLNMMYKMHTEINSPGIFRISVFEDLALEHPIQCGIEF